ncbi:MAG: TonB-dependent receptor [Ignavibacteriae bacterium]|nr:TonB-dependent receptor [Ignavibacteriota bacterium]
MKHLRGKVEEEGMIFLFTQLFHFEGWVFFLATKYTKHTKKNLFHKALKEILTVRLLLGLIFFMMNPWNVRSQVIDSTKELKTYKLEEVLIHGRRLSAQIGMMTKQLRKTDIEELSANTVSDLISISGGVFVKDYGGSGIKTISQRGLGTEHSVILLNGMRVSSMQNGLMDLGMFPVEELELLEIAQGGYSALVGADAIGGVVNLVTIPSVRQNKLRLRSSFGSFGEQELSVNGSVNIGNANVRVGAGQQRSKGNFPFTFSNGYLTYNLERKNVDLRATHETVQTSFSLNGNDLLNVAGYWYSSERGSGGLVVGPVGESKARQTDDEGVFQTFYYRSFEKNFSFGLNAQLHHQYERYSDPLLNVAGKPLDNYFKNNELRFEPTVSYINDSSLSLTLGGEFVNTFAEGNVMKTKIQREQYAAYIRSDLHLDVNTRILRTVALIPSVRYDIVSSLLNSFSPQLETRLHFKNITLLESELMLRMNISKNFRAPTFNELYWSGGGGIGNPNLNPERAFNFDGGILYTFIALGSHSLKATYYTISMTDRIIWTAAGFGVVTPKNVRSVSSYGIETAYNGTLFDELLAIDLNYTNGKSVKTLAEYSGDPTIHNQLPFVPEEMMNFAISINNKVHESFVSLIGVTFTHQFVGYRFTTEDNKNYVPGYRLYDGNIRLRSKVGSAMLNMKFEVKNIFEQEYQVMPAYPMPMRSYRFSFSIELT